MPKLRDPGLVVLHERFEYFGTLFGRDRLPVVGDGDRRRPVVRPDVYFDVGFRVFQGVVQQVVENLVHGRFVCVDADIVLFRREREPQVACFGGLLERRAEESGALHDVHRFAIELVAALLDPHEVEKLPDQLVEIVRAVADRLQVVAVGRTEVPGCLYLL